MSKKDAKKTNHAGLLGYFPEIWGYVGMILLCNMHIISGNLPEKWVFFPHVNECRFFLNLIMHPFVHVTWYHLLLDGVGFLIVYTGLQQRKIMIRLAYALFCGIGSVMLPLCLAADTLAYGLCGLSGIAHGLMAISALEMAGGRTLKLGILCFAIVFTKSVVEAVTGNVLFSFLHFGMMGLPVAASHLGGVLGGCFAYWVFRLPESKILFMRKLYCIEKK